MANIDLSGVTSALAQAAVLQQKAATLPPGPAKDILDAQVAMLQAQAQGAAQHMQAQVDAQANVLDQLNLWQTLQSTVGVMAPSIITLFRK